MSPYQNTQIKKIAICNSGGDAPGLNAVIRAVTLSAIMRGWKVDGVRDGFHGILSPKEYENQGFISLTRESVSGITHQGGTILGTSNRNNPLKYPMMRSNGSIQEEDRSGDIIRGFRLNHIDALILVGGIESLAIASVLAKKGLRLISIPKTINNDLDKTDVTFGFDTAVKFATEALDRLHSTAASHDRVIVVEVMGHFAGWIALHSGVSGSADVILIPEHPYDIHQVIEKIKYREARGNKFTIVMVAEGAYPIGGRVTVVEHEVGHLERFGGIGEKVAAEIQAISGKETCVVTLGHLLRGGSPTSFDRLTALRFGAAAVRGLGDGQTGVMVALDPPQIKYVPIDEVVGKMKMVSMASDIVLTAQDLGISFG